MKNLKQVFKIGGIVTLVIIIALGIYLVDLFGSDELKILQEEDNQKLVNALVIGYDAGADGIPRPDTIFLASVDLVGNGLGIVSLPRDTRVKIPGNSNYTKLNSTYSRGGIDLTIQTVEQLLNTPIHFSIELDFDGFVKIVDVLGGVEINVRQRMHYRDEAGGLYINLQPGLQVLDGEKALQFVRFREPIRADIGRIERQQQLMNALIDQAFKMSIIPKIPNLLNELSGFFRTDLPFRDMARLSKMLVDFPRDRIEMTILPGTPEYIGGISYWVPNQEGIEMVSLSMLNTKDYLENVRYEVDVLNGAGISGLAGDRGEILENWGFTVRKMGNAERFDYEYTSIYYGTGGLEGALRVSSLIGGVPRENEELNSDEIRIILGEDQKRFEEGGTI